MATIAIIMGSVYGAAQEVAQEIHSAITAVDLDVVFNTPASIADLTNSDAVLVVTSTTGQGDLPSNLEPFYFAAREQMPLLNGKPFGVICLGDSSYQTFCGAGDKMEELLFELQGKAPLAMLRIDACETLDPQSKAMPWFQNWLTAIETE